ncbi:magnesium transporter [Acinetobacter calcoaceticus]|uniref:Magnesium transporter n=1 Tax=Acinetobacter calcoaceticus TaxID=471 RepID=A0A4R1YA75_ACICA|nr:magnesium transporter [Acinetobacter calcoaceticus]
MFKTDPTQTTLLPNTATDPRSMPLSDPLSARWLKLIAPNRTEINNVAQKYDIPTEFIEAALDPHAISRLQQKQHCRLIISHLPFEHLNDRNVPFSPQPFGIIILDQVVIMVCIENHSIFDRMLQHHLSSSDAQPHQTDHANQPAQSLQHSVYRLLELGADQFIYAIKTVNQYIEDVELELKASIKNRQVFKLLNHNKSLNRFASSLKANAKVLQQLQRQALFEADPSSDELLLNLMVETEQAQAMAEIHNLNLCNLMDAYSAAIENNLSLLVQYLSIFVVVGAIPLGIASIYGMNIPLPMQEQPFALAVLAIVAVVTTALMLIVMKKRQII